MATSFDKISAYDLQVLNAVAQTGSFHRAATPSKTTVFRTPSHFPDSSRFFGLPLTSAGFSAPYGQSA